MKPISANYKYRLRKIYSLTVEQYISMLMSQDYRCDMCHIHVDELNRRLAVDHDHKTNHIRALLCSACNTFLGHHKDNIDRLSKSRVNPIKIQQSITYINKHK